MSNTYQFPQLPIHNSILHPPPYLPSTHKKHIRLQFEHSLDKSFSAIPLQPIHTSSPPWILPPPNTRFDLTDISTTDKTTHVKHIRKLLQEFPNHTLCLTDGSKSKSRNRAAYAYSIDGSVKSYRIRNIASIFTAELMAIFACLSHLSQLPSNSKFILLTDSLSSLHSIMDPYTTHCLIQRIHLTLLSLESINTQITFIWIPGHIDLPEHDAVDRAAQQATRYTKITDHSLLPASDYRNYYRSLILQKWDSSHWKSQTYNN